MWHESGGAGHFDVYTSGSEGSFQKELGVVRVYDGADHHLKAEVKGVSKVEAFAPSIAVDQESGDFYVGDLLNRRVNHFCRDGKSGFALCEE